MAVSVDRILRWKQTGAPAQPITVLTAWDVMSGQIVDQAGADIVLVGDSLAMVALGYDTTLPLTTEDMVICAKAVRRGVKNALLVVDLPFLSYQTSVEDAIRAAGQMLKIGAQAVKLEGGHDEVVETVRRLVQWGIPVMGHVGLTPQSVNQLGGFRKQGKTPEEGDRILAEAKALEQAGAFCVVLEHIPAELARNITKALSIPTIGIGAGVHCDGQVLVTADVLGLSAWQPPFAKVYANLRQQAVEAAQQFCEEVRSGQYPA
ncbi:3-methyl-2-oxobutanoate hydroxymethyltransferase [Phormidium tenue]|uniref:3-methyl-2-oxobutanoate hydroxymethyltransferase n=1 Tax=Phormidium tenue NIES-30 TaxID=549789 RepID=A0A1U7J6S3_9CYAN|nr:3-methyl-2-oxobutanoate hydroxymethyltransferase [Phormidium tenue]MBD2233494.1 3-methyl-2-oxobutanoate hydroxymethyltransferase [Phormidium tenue FACHB-1052]OKH48606.1 3-methyl-2-oxobutanoate hydroxymethyltransferase [Phormidium tenue NIES-30]